MHTRPLTAALTALLLLTACSAPKPIEDPAVTAVDRDQSPQKRSRAIKLLAAELADPALAASRPQLRESLKKVAWGRRQSAELRALAVDALLADDPADTRTMLGLITPTESSVEMLRVICDRAVANNWVELTGPLVRSWSRRIPGVSREGRPEPEAVAALHPSQPIEDTVFSVFATTGTDRPFAEKERRAAWEVMGLLDPTGTAAAQRVALLDDQSDDPLILAVRDSAVSLAAVPVTQQQLEWLTLLRENENRAFFTTAKELVAALTPPQREGLALRHAAALVATDALAQDRLRATRTELLSELTQRLSSRTKTVRTAEGTSRNTTAEGLDDATLSYADALHVLIIDDVLQTPAVTAALFEQADRDHLDTSTELGGLFRAIDTTPALGYQPVLYPPRPAQRRNDTTFIAAPEMFTQHPDALAHFHFHAQKERNARYAGPGPGDTAYADAFGRANIVLTFVDPDTLAVDYYHPGGTTLDLGRITRPQGSNK